MKLTVLGCWAPFPAPNQACSGYLLECEGRRLLIDLGHGSFGKLQQVCDFSKLDAVFISHLHPDHCADLSCLRHAVLSLTRQGTSVSRLPLYVPCEPPENFRVLADFEDAFEINIIDRDQSVKIAGMDTRLFRTAHPIPTFGLLLEEGGRKFVYTSDTAWEDRLVDICSGADVLLCEASLSQKDSHLAAKGHLTTEEAARLAEKAETGQLILTHFWPGYDLEELREEVSSVIQDGFDLARELGEYIF